MKEALEELFLLTKRYLGDNEAELEEKKWVQPLHKLLRFKLIEPKLANRRIRELMQIIGSDKKPEIILEDIRSFVAYAQFLSVALYQRSNDRIVKRQARGVSADLERFFLQPALLEHAADQGV
jgi:hypothetical protein